MVATSSSLLLPVSGASWVISISATNAWSCSAPRPENTQRIAHVAFKTAPMGLVNVLDRNHLDVTGDAVLDEIEASPGFVDVVDPKATYYAQQPEPPSK